MGNKKPITPEQRKAAQRKLALLGGIAVALLLLNFVYQIWHRYAGSTPAPAPLTQNNCHLNQQACSVILPNNRGIEFSIEPKTLLANKPITFSVKLTQIIAEKVSLYLLPLGVKDPQRTILDTTEENGIYRAHTTLPTTTAANQPWMVMVVVKTKDETIGVPFKLSAVSK